MKQSFNQLLHPTLTKCALLAALVITVAAFKGPNSNGSYKLGGTWVGRSAGVYGDVTWITTYSPDSSGQNAKLTTEWITPGDYQPLVNAPIGGERLSIASGYTRMTGRDTAFMEAIWYIAGPSDEPTFRLDEIKGIAVMTGNLRFTDAKTCVGTYYLKMYATGGNPSMVPTEDMILVFDSERDLPESLTAVNNIVF